MEKKNNYKDFMVKSVFLDGMKERIYRAVDLINEAIKNKQPILVRHHSDCDGYSGGINIERVLLKKLGEFHRRETDVYYYYKRLPSKTPYYDYSDALKDITGFLVNNERFGRNMPLIIVIDNGSDGQDVLAFKRLKQYGVKLLVIDHHPYSEEIDSIVDVHINPMMIKGYTYEFSAGMLSAEVAHLLDDKETDKEKTKKILIAALSGVSDKISGNELNYYLQIAKEEGFDEEKLKKIANAIDFELSNIGFLESRAIVDDLFFGNLEIMDKAVDLLSEEVEKYRSAIRKIVEEKLEIVEKKTFVIGKFNVDKYEVGRGFPPRGKYAGVVMECLGRRYADKNQVVIAYGDDYMTFRGTKGASFDLHELVSILKEKIPYATFGGGGHKLAGTIHFQQGLFNDVFIVVDKYLDNLK